MLKKTKKGYYILEKFASQLGLVHGFSTRKFGDMRAKKSLSENHNFDRFLKLFGKNKGDLVLMEQVHGRRVKMVDEKDRGKVIAGVDGMVTTEKGLILGVKTADCLPVLFFDPKTRVVGVAHAGWRGILEKIGQAVVRKMELLGVKAEDIVAGIGPHIGPCCYSISKERANRFLKQFGLLKAVEKKKNQATYLDLTEPFIIQLMEAGVKKEKIDFDFHCTACRIKEFFSYRKDSEETFGEMLGFITTV